MRLAIATEPDAPVVASMVNLLIEELGGVQLPTVEAQAAAAHLLRDRDAGFAVLAWEGTKPVGACTVSIQHAVRTLGRYGIIQEIYVTPESRSLGVGAELIALAQSEAEAQGCRTIELGTPPHGDRQIAFYQRAGFTPVGMRLRSKLMRPHT
jgi:ribosomal protein S18 acetylase RimI-like enzyme